MIILGIMAWHKVGRLFHLSTFHIILPSPLISNLPGLSPLVLQNRYAPDSLYRNISNLHDEGRPSDALEILQIVLEDSKQKQRQKDWQYNADVEINMDAKFQAVWNGQRFRRPMSHFQHMSPCRPQQLHLHFQHHLLIPINLSLNKSRKCNSV